MKITKLNCSACGAPISIPENLDYINCASCGSFLAIERGEGYVALKVAEKIARAIEDSGKGTQQAIQEGTQVTRSELQRLQYAQEISTLQLQLSNVQAEIRGLMNTSSSGARSRQLSELRSIEFQTMDRIRALVVKSAALGPQDSETQIKNIETEIKWIDAEISTLFHVTSSNRHENKRALENRKSLLGQELIKRKSEELRNTFNSFQVKELPLTNHAQAAALLTVMAEEEVRLQRLSHLPEAKALRQELQGRRAQLQDAWRSMEEKRVHQLLGYQGGADSSQDRVHLAETLRLIDEDLARLDREPANDVIAEMRKNLWNHKRSIEKQIRKLEREEHAAARRANRTSEAGFSGWLGGIVIATGAFFAGIIALVSRPFASQPTTPTASLAGEAAAQSVAETAKPLSESSPSPELKASVNPGSVGMGCLSAFLLFLAGGITGFLIYGIFFSSLPGTQSTSGIGVFLLCSTIGFALGVIAFFRKVAPDVRIRGFGRLPDLKFAYHSTSSGLSNRSSAKGLVGLAVLVLIYGFLFSVTVIFDPELTHTAAWVVCISPLLSIVVAILVASRTTVPLPMSNE